MIPIKPTYVLSVTKHKRAASDYFSLIELKLAGTFLVRQKVSALNITQSSGQSAALG